MSNTANVKPVKGKYTLTASARRQREKAAAKSAQARKGESKWVGTSVTVQNKEWAVAVCGSIDEAINLIRRLADLLDGISIHQFVQELAKAGKIKGGKLRTAKGGK